jgi:hypothetical protein
LSSQSFLFGLVWFILALSFLCPFWMWQRKNKYKGGAGMKSDAALSFGNFAFLLRYGGVIPLEELWEDGSIVWGFIRCNCCGREVDKAVLLNSQYYCENCLEEKVQ